jgi:hypothetical protein
LAINEPNATLSDWLTSMRRSLLLSLVSARARPRLLPAKASDRHHSRSDAKSGWPLF